FQAEDGIRVFHVTGVQTCVLPILGALLVRRWKRQLTFVMQPEPQPGARALHDALRRRAGITTTYAGERPERGLRLLEALGRGEEIGRASWRERGEGAGGGMWGKKR